MKLEREPVFGHKSLNHKVEAKSFDYSELSLDSDGLKKVASENQIGQMHDFKDCEKDAGSLLYLVSDGNEVAESELDFTKNDEATKSPQDDRASDKSEILSLETDRDCFVDKSAIECELPEFQVCYKENGFSSVKDICIDEGDKTKSRNSVDSNKSLRTFVFSDQEMDKEIDKEHGDGRSETGSLGISNKDESKNEFVCDSKNSVPGVEVYSGTTDKIANDISQDEIFSENVNLEEQIGEEDPQFISPCNHDSVQISSDKESEDLDLVTEEAKSSGIANELSYFSKVEKRRITFDFDSSASITNARDHLQNNIPERSGTETPPEEPCTQIHIHGCDEPPIESTETQLSTIVDDGISDAPIESTETSSVNDEISATHNLAIQLRHIMAEDDMTGIGESSFSAAGPVSGRMNYSGTVPYSGSISLRSDSSTTSTRSFAFPILQSDWHSSPVRMAKAERGHFRKHRGWRQGLLCCRF